MHKNFYELEVGIHITKYHEDFEWYSVKSATEVTNFAYYDENILDFFNYSQAKQYADNYVRNGVKGTYAFIYLDEFNFDEKGIKDVEENWFFDHDNIVPKYSEWLYYIYKDENGNIITKIDKEKENGNNN